MISVLLADDHAIVRSGIKHMINSQTDMKVIDEAENGEEAVHKALEKKPDVIIMDLNMPKKSGLIATKQINEANNKVKIIVLTMHEGKEYLFHALQAGASSYLLKSYHEYDLLEAIRTVYRGEAYLYPNATKLLLEEYMKKSIDNESNLQKLTGREQEVLSYLAKGYTNREIGEILFLSIKTIESHRSKIMDKLQLKTRPDLVEFAVKNGYLDFD
ncbi:response regulator transcription factor [Solibacillus sp. MA9]|uniref:Response regulator transcription factor n=1 Tax=Solibacillus palustris TaxID=2908203 RepID=A0ABS9UFK9_9BACL|nr:response regulator transcription factor [Solibacillus sp. MA9]MCH7322920.1 response regulator transcription factor [Solibacillus sp. MA9]